MNQNESRLELDCEYLKEPMGVQNESPRFSWKVSGSLEDSRQVSYRLWVKGPDGIVWDSRKVVSGKSTAVVYEGRPLVSRTGYSFTVTIEVEKEGSITVLEGAGSFETGIFLQEEWKGGWIRPGDACKGRAPLIRRQFSLESLPAKARLYVCGLGYCEVTLNGKRVGSGRLDPGWTDYQKTVLYRVYDVSPYLQEGENVLGLELGEGWQGLEHIFFQKAFGRNPSWNARPRTVCNLWLDEECIYTCKDGSWLTAAGPVLENNIYDGEVYDANARKEGWDCPGYDILPGEWQPAVEAEAPGGILRCQLMPQIEERSRVQPVHAAYVKEDPDYSMVLDFGKNMAGWAEIAVSGRPGASITLKYAEVLNGDGTVNQKNLRYAKARDVYIIGKNGKGRYHPRFTYHGFRYLQIEMEPGTLILSAEAVQVSSGMEKAAEFECSDSFVNRIYETVMKTEENNIHSVPTDCPQRDERLGWVNDMTIRYENAIYNYDMTLLYEKWMQDLADSQDSSGAVPDTAPYFFGGRPGCHITSVFVLIPWCLYSFTNDRQLLARNYQNMKRYVAFKLGEREESGLLPDTYFGEWAPPMTEAVWGWGENAVPKNIPQPLITTCYLYYDCQVMSRISRELGFLEDEAFYLKTALQLKKDINRNYYREEGFYGTGSQGSDAMPLFLDMVPEGGREKVLEHLISDIVTVHNCHLTTGNQMTKLIYEILMESGKEDLAYELTVQKTYPSVGYMLEQGATTVWERWENLTCNHMNSHDHPMLGAFAVWLLKGLGGLRAVPGESQCYEIRPVVPGKLDYVKLSRRTAGGILRICWKKTAEGLWVDIHVPWNTEAWFRVPGGYGSGFGTSIRLRSGRHTLELNRKV